MVRHAGRIASSRRHVLILAISSVMLDHARPVPASVLCRAASVGSRARLEGVWRLSTKPDGVVEKSVVTPCPAVSTPVRAPVTKVCAVPVQYRYLPSVTAGRLRRLYLAMSKQTRSRATTGSVYLTAVSHAIELWIAASTPVSKDVIFKTSKYRIVRDRLMSSLIVHVGRRA